MRGKKKRVILSVTNDLVSDQRVHKISTSLIEMGFDVSLVGRMRPWSDKLNREYSTRRMKLFFSTKVWFYAEYNLRLFFYLLFRNFDVYVANDLDTLLPNYLVSKIKGKSLVYDSHEYFTEVPELLSRPRIRNVWLRIEKYIFPKLKTVYTVNDSIANIYNKKYGVDVKVIRNVAPSLKNKTIDLAFADKIKGDKRMLIMQGAGINIDRGAEELVQAMQFIENTVLYIIGSGDVFSQLHTLVDQKNLKNKVFLLDKMPYQQLMEYTKIADLGLSLDKGTNPNYENALPNKVFDYIQAEIPLLVSNRKVVSGLVQENKIGFVVDEITPQKLSDIITRILKDEKQLGLLKEQLKIASQKYSWEHEAVNLQNIYRTVK